MIKECAWSPRIVQARSSRNCLACGALTGMAHRRRQISRAGAADGVLDLHRVSPCFAAEVAVAVWSMTPEAKEIQFRVTPGSRSPAFC
jgi:phage FluMu protein gp41